MRRSQDVIHHKSAVADLESFWSPGQHINDQKLSAVGSRPLTTVIFLCSTVAPLALKEIARARAQGRRALGPHLQISKDLSIALPPPI